MNINKINKMTINNMKFDEVLCIVEEWLFNKYGEKYKIERDTYNSFIQKIVIKSKIDAMSIHISCFASNQLVIDSPDEWDLVIIDLSYPNSFDLLSTKIDKLR